ncbi:glycosyl transferase family 1 [Anaerocolumna cellulosilytica]|uniref:Glycosyl transferase family 1 n=1 Tax=Anaerocolumna cellulosilytica TaxID=433286 RepID=A0A6S6R1N2_9FIRM|nr:macrolide family glycosyltransferase [Anaerocolumna cellulosilytica]MBB5195757.1 MGT family glycosyltransferase [Anaerocolumna cellulosilytica]BCJ92908.1 glycosyl transferase family 1 [Anaerocolumna cellulosilytica]
MDILFINANLYGHINPTLGLVKKLVKRGHQVSYFCSEPFSEQVTNMGAKWIGYSNNLEAFLKGYQPTDRHPFYMLMEYMLSYDEVVLPEIQDIINKNQFDMIICDSYFGGGCFLKHLTKIPVVCSHSSFAMSKTPLPERMLVPGFHPQLDNCNQILRRICKKYTIEELTLEEVFTSKGDLNIVYTTRNFNGDANIQEPTYLFNGPSIESRQEESCLDLSVIGSRKLIYISLGSLNTDFTDFYKMCIAAFSDLNYYVYMSIGKRCDVSQLGEIPQNFTIKSYLPQIEILKRADVFITHAGFNSVNEALYFGVPMFALPLVNDQYMVAKRLTSMKLGICEDMKEMSAGILRDKTENLLADVEIKERCMQSSLDMKNTANLEQTVLRLEDYVNGLKEGN